MQKAIIKVVFVAYLTLYINITRCFLAKAREF